MRYILIGGAWPYANSSLHLGHIAALISGDVLARYHRQIGDKVLYVSGTDCHGTPITERAKKEKISPREISEKYHKEFSKVFENMEFSYDLYTKTDNEYHEEKVKVCYVLDYVFGISMKLLHPFMPFITTKIYRSLVQYNDKDLMVSKWPHVKTNLEYEKEEKIVENLKNIIVEIRNIRANMNVHPSKKANLIFVTNKYEDAVWEAKEFLLKLGFGEKIIVQKDKVGIKENAISILGDGIELYMPFEGLVDIEEERKRLEEEKKKLESEVQRCEKMLSNPGFINKAPQKKIEEEKAKLEKYTEMLNKVKDRLK